MKTYAKLKEQVADLVAFHGVEKCKELAKRKALEIDETWWNCRVSNYVTHWTIADTAEWLIEIFDFKESDSKPAIETVMVKHFEKYKINEFSDDAKFNAILAKNQLARRIKHLENIDYSERRNMIAVLSHIENYIGTGNQPGVADIFDSE